MAYHRCYSDQPINQPTELPEDTCDDESATGATAPNTRGDGKIQAW